MNIQDTQIFELIQKEQNRQSEQLQLIPSENFTSKQVRNAVGSVLMHKYSEGQPTKRFYQGNAFIDEIELLTKKRALELFNLDSNEWDVNVQAVSGSIANLAVYFALLQPNDKIMSMHLYDGGHLSHGATTNEGEPISMTAKIFDFTHYHVDPTTSIFDYTQIEDQANEIKPKIIMSGGTAYPREIQHQKLSQIAKSIGAYYFADIAHEAGLVAAGVNISPFEYADVVTMTTRKTLRGPVGALIFSKKELSSQIDKTILPGLQGGPLNHSIAGISVALYEAMQPEFKTYAQQCIINAQTLAQELIKLDFKVLSGGTDKHLILIDITNKGLDGWYAGWALEYAGIIANRNTIPQDTSSPYYPSGLRLGTPFETTRGMKEPQMIQIAQMINEAITVGAKLAQRVENQKQEGEIKFKRREFKKSASNNAALLQIANRVKTLCSEYKLEF